MRSDGIEQKLSTGRHVQTLVQISKLPVFDSSHLTEFLCMHNRKQEKWHPEVQMIKK